MFRGEELNSKKKHLEETQTPIELDSMAIVTKLSKVQFDLKRLRVTEEELFNHYITEGEDIDRVFSSHRAQKQFADELRVAFPNIQFIDRDELASTNIEEKELIIAVGGDGHFEHVSHYISNEKLILGVNNDPENSYGAYLSVTKDNAVDAILRVAKGHYAINKLTRLEVKIGDKVLPPAISDIFIGEARRQYMSHHKIQKFKKNEDGSTEELSVETTQHCSGFLIATGSGSSGWFHSVSSYPGHEEEIFSKNLREARFTATEASPLRHREAPEMLRGVITQDEVLRITSRNKREGILSIDSLIDSSFERGKVAEISISKESLNFLEVTK